MFSRLRTDRGFTLTEVMMVIAVMAIIMGMALPVMTDLTRSIKLNEAARTVERELQAARLKAVSTNSLLRVRTNCPTTGYIRTVEVLGTAADNATNRCLQSAYPFPPADTEMTTVPNFDGPVRNIPNGATVGTTTIEFRADGSAASVAGGVVTVIVTPVTLTITRMGKSRTVTVNGIGKVQIQ